MNLASFTDVLADEICNSQPMSLTSSVESTSATNHKSFDTRAKERPAKGTGQRGHFRSTEEIDPKYRDVFTYPYFNLVQSRVIEDALYSDKSIVVCAPTGSGKTVVFEMAIVQLLMDLEDKHYTEDFKIIYMAPVKALCTERLTEWYTKFTKLGLLCIEVTGDTDVDFTQLKPYKIIITTPEKWDMLTRRWRDHRSLVEVIKLFLIDEVHILNDETRGPVLEAVVSRMKTIESSAQSVHRIEKLQTELQGGTASNKSAPRIRFVAVSATVSNPEDVASWLETSDKPAVFYKFGDECRPVKLKRIVEGYPCSEGTSIFKFDIILNYKLWPIIQKYHSGKPTLIFCNTRKSVILTAETLSRELTVSFNAEQTAKLTAVAASIKNKKLQALVMNGVGCHHAGLLYEERQNIELAFRNRDLPILITTTTLAMGVNLPAHLVIVKNTQQYVNGAYQEYSISTVLQMVGRAGRPQFDTEATAVIMTRLVDKPRYQALVGGSEPLQSFLHKRLAENLNSEAALGTVGDVAQCVQWLRSTFLYVRAARDPKKYLGLPQNSPQHLISKKIEELCVKAMNGLASSGLITMDEASCIESTKAGQLMSIFYLDLETMKHIMKIEGAESLDNLLALICESHELADMHLRVDERRCLNTLNRNNAAATIRFPMKGKITTRQMKLNCIIQAVLGCLSIPDPSLNQEAMKIMRIADRVCKCLVTYITRPDLISHQPQFYAAVLNSIILEKCIASHLWENSPFVSKQLKGIGPTFSSLLASAGKVNFMLLEESHPRDLERIMNKGAPAGNILRKQISLLPKYQLTIIPVDEKTVTIQLVLLNLSHLAENMDSLTAGSNHKSYIIVGDSENHLLLLVAFKDKDLISVFDGTITHEVRRKHNFEHKIFAHCVSSSFVGIDVQSEYLFNDLEQFFRVPTIKASKNVIPTSKKLEKQTCITDTFKERKRKNTDAIDKTQSKEKKKRDNAIIENFKYLKESFETASKNLKQGFVQQNISTQDIPNKIADTPVTITNSSSDQSCVINTDLITNATLSNQNNDIENLDSDEFIDDEKIDSILTEIENEMNKNKISSTNTKAFPNNNNSYYPQTCNSLNPFSLTVKAGNPKNGRNKTDSQTRQRKPIASKSKYNFIDLLERNLSISDDDNEVVSDHKDNGFSETIKNQIQKYLSKTYTKVNAPDRNVEILLDIPEKDMANSIHEINSDYKRSSNPHPRYEIKEILGLKNVIQQNKKTEIPQEICDNNKHPVETDEEYIKHIDKDSCMKNIAKIVTYKPVHDTNTVVLNKIDFSNINNNENHKGEANNTDLCKEEMVFIGAGKSSSSNIYLDKESPKLFSVHLDSSDNINYDNKYHKFNLNYTKPDVNMTDSHDCSNKSVESNNEHANNLWVHTEFVPGCQQTKLNDLNTMSLSNSKILYPEVYDSSVQNVTCLDLIPKNNNLVLEQNSTLENDNALLTKNINLIKPHHKQSNKRGNNSTVPKFVCPYVSSKMDDVLKLTGHLPEDLEVPKQKTEFVKEYTFSASKIDVHVKQTPEYKVQVIKKVRLDMDITTIISRKQNYFQKCNINNSKNNEDIIDIEIQNSSDNIFGHGRPDIHDNNYYITDESNDSTNQLQGAKEPAELQITQYTSVNNSIKPPNNDIISQNNKSNHCPTNKHNDISNYNFAKPHQDVTTTPINEIPKTNSDEQGNVIDNYENINEKLTIESTGTPIKENSLILDNILQKYGKILRKNPANNIISNFSTNKNVIGMKSPTIKSKKPFKITDIHKLHAPIPTTIIDPKPEIKTNTLRLPKTQFDKDDNIEVERELVPNLYAQCIDAAPVTDRTVPNHDFVPDLDLEAIHLPTDVDLESSKEFKMDQLMFDPKTLLQCVVNEDIDEIVPPPPEFCDSVANPSSNNIDACTADDYSQHFNSQLGHCSERDFQNESIFEDTCSTDLTPSREIETWNLSREDSWEPATSMNISPTKSFTVMRRKNLYDYNFSQNSVISRRDRLGKFKLKQKNKLKIKK